MLDTNMYIYLIKHQPPEVRERFVKCFVGDVIISAVTLAELEFGMACTSEASQKTNRTALDSLLEDIFVASFDAQAAKAYGPIRAAYKERNRDALYKQRSGLLMCLLISKPALYVIWLLKFNLTLIPN